MMDTEELRATADRIESAAIGEAVTVHVPEWAPMLRAAADEIDRLRGALDAIDNDVSAVRRIVQDALSHGTSGGAHKGAKTRTEPR